MNSDFYKGKTSPYIGGPRIIVFAHLPLMLTLFDLMLIQIAFNERSVLLIFDLTSNLEKACIWYGSNIVTLTQHKILMNSDIEHSNESCIRSRIDYFKYSW